MGEVRFSEDGREIGEEFGVGIDVPEAEGAERVEVGSVLGVEERGEVVFKNGS